MLKTISTTLTLALAAGLTASADFRYTDTQKATGGSMAAMAGASANRTEQYYFKGQKMARISDDNAMIIDFGARTVTTINKAQKTYTVRKFGELAGAGANMDVSVDVKDTGQKKMVNGFNATETVITMSMDMAMGRGAPAMKMQIEMDLWVSPDVPGSGEMHAFFQKNAANFPWSAMMNGGGNPSMAKAMAQMERKMAEMNGVVVERVIRDKPAGGPGGMPAMPAMPQLTPEQQAQMQAAMAQMKNLPPAQQAQMQAMMGRMGQMSSGQPAAGSAGGALIEMTADAGGFSTATIPESEFEVPAGYRQTP